MIDIMHRDGADRAGRRVWEVLDGEVVVLDPDSAVVYRLSGDAAVAGRALLSDAKVPAELVPLAAELIAAGIVPTGDGGGVSRRVFLRRSGAAAAIAGVTTLVLPAAAAAASTATPAVANLQSSDVTETGATLTWSALAGATAYTIEFRLTSTAPDGAYGPLGGTAPTTTNTSFVVGTLDADTSYDFRVVADLSGGGISSPSNVVTVLTLPPAPQNVQATSTSLTSVTVTWT